jgi:hypothetical protein
MSTPTAIEIMSATVKETAAALRSALREAFPGVKFSVRMATGTAYGWISLSWTDGPTSAQVRKIAANFESERFSGLDDSYHSTGVTQWSCCGITDQRSISRERIAEAVAMIEHDTEGEAFIRRPDGSVAFSPYPHFSDEQLALIYWQKVAA